jgi:hypothetical protein
MRRLHTKLAFVLLGVVAVITAARADIVVADNFTPSFTFSGFRTDVGYRSPPGSSTTFLNMAPAQRFIASQPGQLTSVTSYMMRWSASSPDIHISIRADSGGRPGAILGERSFTAGDFPASYFPPNPPVTLDLSSLNLTLSASQPYHVVFRTDTSVVSSAFYSLHMQNPHANSFGFAAYESRDGGATWPALPSAFGLEIPLQVRVVPEPSAIAWLVICACAARRRPRQPR